MGPYLVTGMVDEQFGVFSVTATAIVEVKAAKAGLIVARKGTTLFN
jgi:hypothetical protein